MSQGKKLVVFHGTGQKLSGFSEDGLGVGGDANSALGVHSTACPAEAAEYARMSCEINDETSARILLLVYTYEKDIALNSSMEFFGIDEYGDQEFDGDHFRAMREGLLKDGVDLLNVEYGEEPIFVLLRPENIRIAGSLTIEEADELGEKIANETIDRFDSSALYKESRSIMKSRHGQPSPLRP